MPCLTEVARLMTEQITLARDKGLLVKVGGAVTSRGSLTDWPHPQKVILIGGFAASPSLSKYLESTLAQISKSQGRQVQLLCPRVP